LRKSGKEGGADVSNYNLRKACLWDRFLTDSGKILCKHGFEEITEMNNPLKEDCEQVADLMRSTSISTDLKSCLAKLIISYERQGSFPSAAH
jgi:hypothetical protein